MKFFATISLLLIILIILSGCTDTVAPTITDVNYFTDTNTLQDNNNDNNPNYQDTNTTQTSFDLNTFVESMGACVTECNIETNDSVICSRNCFAEFAKGIDRNQLIKLLSPCLSICRRNGGEQDACLIACRDPTLLPVEKCVRTCMTDKNNISLCNSECRRNPTAYPINSGNSTDNNTPNNDIPSIDDNMPTADINPENEDNPSFPNEQIE